MGINSIYDYDKINTLFKNFDNIILDLVMNYQSLHGWLQ